MSTYYQPGLHKFRVANQGFGHAQNEKSTPYFFLEGTPVAQIIDGEECSLDVQYQRQIVWYITDNTVDFVTRDLMKLGWDGVKWSDMDVTGPCQFAGQEIEATCKHEASQKDPSKLYERWSLPFEQTPTESDSSVAKKLDNLFGRKMKSKAAKAAKAQTVPADDAASVDDELPF